jgi:hypothetical protein
MKINSTSSTASTKSGLVLIASSAALIGLATYIAIADRLFVAPLLIVPLLIIAMVHWVATELFLNN